MSVGITEEHAALADATRRWAAREAPISSARAHLADEQGGRPACWAALAAQGLLGLHVEVDSGGSGGALADLAVAAEQLGYGLVSGSFLPTVVASAALSLEGGDAARRLLPGLADGTTAAAFAPQADDLTLRADDGGLRVSGTVGPVLGADADVLLLSARTDGGERRWFLTEAHAARVEALDSLDPTRPLAAVHLDGALVAESHVLAGLDADVVNEIAVTLAAAEAAGIAAWCLETATEHAKVREQFGRPIGQFQAVKHTCADMLVRVEQARAAAWDAANTWTDPAQRPLAGAVAGTVALDAAVDCAKACIQVLGGIGFTWEHDAHLYLRRALTLRQLLGPTARWRRRAAELALAGARRALHLELPAEEAAPAREEVRAFVASIDGLDDTQRRRRLADEGYLQPHWPRPWGRGADPVSQLVIDEEFARAGVDRPDLVIGGWILPTLIAHGTAEQQSRFIPPTLYGEVTWCQLFSEPGAGSDLASLEAKATRTEGGWVLNGQKVWTSLAHQADWGLCLARTDRTVGKHEGITCFVVDMRAEGIDIRPLREITGHDMFNEVFLADVFVPDDQVVGDVNNGWRVGRTTLANERVAMSTGSTMGAGVEGVLEAVTAGGADDVVLDRVGGLVAEGQVLALLGFRTTLRKMSGLDPGAASSVRKLVGMHHAQDCAELALELCGPAGATTEGPARAVALGFLQSRCLTIAGGTTEVQRNVVAERILGLPRDDVKTGRP